MEYIDEAQFWLAMVLWIGTAGIIGTFVSVIVLPWGQAKLQRKREIVRDGWTREERVG